MAIADQRNVHCEIVKLQSLRSKSAIHQLFNGPNFANRESQRGQTERERL